MAVPIYLKKTVTSREFESLDNEVKKFIITSYTNNFSTFDKDFKNFIKVWAFNEKNTDHNLHVARRKSLFSQLGKLTISEFEIHFNAVKDLQKNNDFSNLEYDEKINRLNQSMPILIKLPCVNLEKLTITRHFIARLKPKLLKDNTPKDDRIIELFADSLCSSDDNENSLKKKLDHLVDWLNYIPVNNFDELSFEDWKFIFKNPQAGQYWTHYATLNLIEITDKPNVQIALDYGLKATLYHKILNAFQQYRNRTLDKSQRKIGGIVGLLGYSRVHGEQGIKQAEDFVKELQAYFSGPKQLFISFINKYIDEGKGGTRDHSFRTYLDNAMEPEEQTLSNRVIQY